MGDSSAYIGSAIYGYIPADRSFTYGWLIRWLAVWPGTLTTLIFAQVLVSAATAWLFTFALLRFFRVHFAVAIAASIAFVLDPLQIVHERLVMTETFTMFIFAGHLLLGFSYLRHPRLVTLAAVCLTGILLVSLRIVYTPIVLAEAVLLPVTRWTLARDWSRAKGLALHLSLSVLMTLVLHGGYRYLVGAWGGVPPTYLYHDGFSLASAWAPLLDPEDAPDQRAAEVIDRQAADRQFPLGNRFLRWAQRWANDGLVNRLRLAFAGNKFVHDRVQEAAYSLIQEELRAEAHLRIGRLLTAHTPPEKREEAIFEIVNQFNRGVALDSYAANAAAKQMSLHAMRRHPLAVAHLTWLTYRDYWRKPSEIRIALFEEQGSARSPPSSFLQELKARFGLDARRAHTVMTPSKRYHLAGGVWCYFLLISPLVCLLAVLMCHSASRSAAILMFMVSSALLLVTCAGSSESSYRFLHPFSFTALIALAIVADKMREREGRAGFAGG